MTVEEELNGRFGIPGVVDFVAGSGGLTKIVIATPQSRAEVYLLGAHVAYWQPVGGQPVIWMSQKSNFAIGQPIRGGVPVCFPWFGPLEGAAGSPRVRGFLSLAVVLHDRGHAPPRAGPGATKRPGELVLA